MVEFVLVFTLLVKARRHFRGGIMADFGSQESFVSRGGNSLHRPALQLQTAPAQAQDLPS